MSSRTIVVVLVVGLSGACSAPPVPQHEVVVVSAPDRASDATPLVEAWMRAQLSTAGSSIQVCAPAQCIAPIVVPSRWGANVLRTKVAFAEQTVRALADAAHHPDRWHPAEAGSFPESTVMHAAPEAALPIDVGQWDGRRTAPFHLVLLCDRSRSVGAADGCTQTSLVRIFDRWLERASVAGSSLTVLRIGTDLASTAEVFAVSTPDGPTPVRLLALLAARARLARVVLDDAEAGSAIVEALYVAADRLRLRTGAKEILLLTDSRQVSVIADFDRTIPQPRTFVAAAQAAGLAPDLGEMRVTFCGANFHGLGPDSIRGATPMTDANAERARRAAWEAAVSAFGAREVQFVTRCRDVATIGSMEVPE